jgi:hypothetical protein
VLAKCTLFRGHLPLLVYGDVVIVVDARARLRIRVRALTLPASSGTERIKLGGQLGL